MAVVPDPVPAHDEYVVESILVGLCGSDRELLHRDASSGAALTIGHESLGRVVVAPDSGSLREGDLVVGTIRSSCTACSGCEAQRFDLCEQPVVEERGLFAADGFGSDYWTASEASLIPVPRSLGEGGVLVEPLSSLVKAHRRLKSLLPPSRPGNVLVTGAGPIGLLAAFLLSNDADRVVLIDPQPRSGAEAAVDSLPRVELLDAWRGLEASTFDAVFECSGNPNALAEAMPHLRHGGVAVLEGIPSPGSPPLPPSTLATAVFRDLTMIGTVNASIKDHHDAVAALSAASDEFLAPFLSHPIEPEGWPAWARGRDTGALKTTVRFARR